MSPFDRFNKAANGPWMNAGDDVNYRVESGADELAIYFGPTHDERGWIANFDFPAVPYSEMAHEWRAHRGFIRLYKSVREIILSAAGPSRIPISIAGYSQGAALALLAYEDISFHFPLAQVSGMGFGTPRVLWGTTPDIFGGFIRCSLRGDFVTHVPFAAMGFRHAGVTLKLKNKIHCRAAEWWTHHLPVQYATALKDN